MGGESGRGLKRLRRFVAMVKPTIEFLGILRGTQHHLGIRRSVRELVSDSVVDSTAP